MELEGVAVVEPDGLETTGREYAVHVLSGVVRPPKTVPIGQRPGAAEGCPYGHGG